MKRRDYIWLFVSCALLGAVLGLLGCVKYIPQTAVWPAVFNGESRGSVLAMTTCDLRGNPIIIVNQEIFGHPDFPRWTIRYILIHEEQHARDMRLFKEGCNKFLETYRTDPDFRLTMEVRAKCAEYVAMKNDGVLAGLSGWDFPAVFAPLYQLYGQHITFDEFFSRIPCRPP